MGRICLLVYLTARTHCLFIHMCIKSGYIPCKHTHTHIQLGPQALASSLPHDCTMGKCVPGSSSGKPAECETVLLCTVHISVVTYRSSSVWQSDSFSLHCHSLSQSIPTVSRNSYRIQPRVYRWEYWGDTPMNLVRDHKHQNQACVPHKSFSLLLHSVYHLLPLLHWCLKMRMQS